MHVKFNAPKRIAGKHYAVGVHPVSDKVAYLQEFKAMVKSGVALVLPRDAAAQQVQAHKDSHTADKAFKAYQSSQAPKPQPVLEAADKKKKKA